MKSSVRNLVARWNSRIMMGVCSLFTVFILSVLVLVIGYIIWTGIRSVDLKFFTMQPDLDPYSKTYPGGMAHGIVGTGVLILLASLIGIPVGMLTGVYLAEYEARSIIAMPVRFVCDVLAGVPSIVVGVLGYELLVVPVGRSNAWAGACALAFIMVPIVARTTEEMLRLVPHSYREASIALGASKARTILGVVLPAATGSVVTGVMLAIARVAGETAPLLFTAAGSQQMPRRPEDLNNSFPSLTQQIYDYARDANPELRRVAWGGVLVLVAMIFAVNLSIRLLTRGKMRVAN